MNTNIYVKTYLLPGILAAIYGNLAANYGASSTETIIVPETQQTNESFLL